MKIFNGIVFSFGKWALLALLLTSGCYWGRLTGNYNTFLGSDMLEKDNAILEETGRDEETIQKNTEILQKIAAEDNEVYRINAGDQIEIRVYGHPDLGMTTKVSPDGYVGMVFLGQIKVSGRTILEASKTIQDGLEPYVKHPVVGITVQEVASETVTLSGACLKPGLYNISDSTRVADVYAMAGGSAVRLFNGVDVDVADLEHSILVREGVIIPVDFRKAVMGDKLNNIKMRKGDYIFIAQRMESSVTICGDVQHPHKRLYEEGMGLVETLATAGWIKETHWSHVILIRD
ncbi:MAG: polysaccharide biosynthesis/export family protein [Kiritimatiellae bacterium]|nr:polysaccharide biosynthesis/export family protein [Kiritimatiellia bacterium]